jgi:predicted N-formylglutamate amidohydrolase
VTKPLLHPDDPRPVGVENPAGTSPILFVSDHAGRAIPRKLGNLGLEEAELSRHIGYDIGIHGVTTELARTLNAAYIFQTYSRLVIDCNRQPGKPQSIVLQSDGTVVPANAGLEPEEIRARETEILRPYQDQIDRTLIARAATGQPTALFAMHSCTDRLRMDPSPRPWQISVIADTDWRLGTALVDVLRAETALCVGVNEPYTVNMAMDYTVPLHAEAKGIAYVEIEIRQDLIGDAAGQHEWASLLTRIFPMAVTRSGIV